jgi:hypothetical protein
MQLLQEQLTEINLCDIAEKLVQKPCFRKLCKWLIQPVALQSTDTKLADRIEVFCNSSGSFNNHFLFGQNLVLSQP